MPNRRIEKLSVVVDGAKFCPEGYHCAPFTFKLANKALSFRHRCQVMPVNYYFVDFEKSSSFSDSDIDMENIRVEREGLHPLSYLICPGEVQELNRPRPIDPFALDVYSTGRMLMKLVMVRDKPLMFRSSNVDFLAIRSNGLRPSALE